MRALKAVALACTIVLGAAASALGQDVIKVYTADLPPWTNVGNKAKPGFAYEVMVEMAKRSGLKSSARMGSSSSETTKVADGFLRSRLGKIPISIHIPYRRPPVKRAYPKLSILAITGNTSRLSLRRFARS